MQISDLPPPFTGPSAWKGEDMAGRTDDWLITLASDQIAELESAARHYLSFGRDIGEITADAFPIPKFAGHLARMREQLLQGIGLRFCAGYLLRTMTRRSPRRFSAV